MNEHHERYGHSGVKRKMARSILTKASGFVDAYDYTLNSYSGCAFGCSYCYAAFFARTDEQQADWGYWVEVKENALELLRKKRKRPLTDKTIYMSSVTDPYQPIEKKLGLTRALLEELLTYHQPNLVIQTRGTLITRDLDLLTQFENVQVNMTVTTDDKTIRKAFEPLCPSTDQRLETIRQVHAAGVQAAVTLTPLLPLRDPVAFAAQLRETGIRYFVVQQFHVGKTRFAAGTGDEAQRLAADMGWDDAAYQHAVAVLRATLPEVHEGKAGFKPRFGPTKN